MDPVHTSGRVGSAQHETSPSDSTADARDIDELRSRLADSEETLRAIKFGEVDAIVVTGVAGDEQVFTLDSADRPYRSFVENMSDGAATVSPEGIVTYANQALADLVGVSCRQIVGQPVLDLVTPASRVPLTEALGPAGRSGAIDAMVLTRNDDAIPVRIGSSSALGSNNESVTCITVSDLSSERRAEAERAHFAVHDVLTGLPNRILLADRIQEALDRRVRRDNLVALLFCDVDGFKNVNDAHGHHVGDEVLRTVADRLLLAVRPEDTVARIGGDEFVVLCEGLSGPDDAAALAARARETVAAPMATGPNVEVTVSIGVAVVTTDDDADADTLLRDADEAMYKAKRQGPNAVQVFDEQLRTLTISRLRLFSELRHVVERGELRLHYQPVLNLEDESVVGVEALIRWQHPVQGLIPPDDFIPFAEHNGLVTEIGEWVMREACQQAAEWAACGHGSPPLYMSLNVSRRQLAQGAGLVRSMSQALSDSGADPTLLVLEVTESALLDDADAAMSVLHELKDLGLRIAIDDFGIGYSSLIYLKRFPVDLLKIDRFFVSGLDSSPDDATIVRSILDLARAFGLVAIAEGIECDRHLEILRTFGCGFGQGYLWSPGLPAEELTPLLIGAATSQGGGWLRPGP